jgi:hypothetical protein
MLRDLLDRGIFAKEPRLSAQDDGIIERPVPDAVRPDHQSEASASAPHESGVKTAIFTDDRHAPNRRFVLNTKALPDSVYEGSRQPP